MIKGYGLVMVVAYRRGSFKGTSGKLPGISLRLNVSKKQGVTAAITIIVLLAACWYVLYGTMYRLMPLNIRVFWLLFATAFMTIGYYVSGCEHDALFLLIGFYLILKSYSGVIGQAQNMLFMYIFCVLLGDYLRGVFRNGFIGALSAAFSFQMFMITSAALIAIF